MGGVHVCESIRVSVYKTATGLHLSCHVGDLCLSPSVTFTACHPCLISLIRDNGWNSDWELKHLLVVGPIGGKMEVRLFFVLFLDLNCV